MPNLDNPRLTDYIIKLNLTIKTSIMQDIKPLLVFATVLEQGSMNGAATALGMTPSAVSQHISRLETLHQVKLLHRSTRHLVPTDAGRALGHYCQQLQRTLNDTHTALNNLKTEAAGEVHLALTSGFIDAPALHNTLQHLQQHYPNIRPVLHVADNLADLQQGGIDIAIRGGDHALDNPDLIARPLATWHWQICAAPAYLAQHTPITHPNQLHQHHWLHFLPIRSILQRDGESYLLDIANSIPCYQLAATRSLTAAGLGLSLQLAGEIKTWVEQGRLNIVLPDWHLPAVHLYAVTPYRVQSAKTEAVMNVLLHYFHNH